jgi:hypothetical protein
VWCSLASNVSSPCLLHAGITSVHHHAQLSGILIFEQLLSIDLYHPELNISAR